MVGGMSPQRLPRCAGFSTGVCRGFPQDSFKFVQELLRAVDVEACVLFGAVPKFALIFGAQIESTVLVSGQLVLLGQSRI